MTDPYGGMDFSGLNERDRQSYSQREGFGGKGIINDALVQQYGIEVFNPAAGNHLMDIIPYPIGENDPEVIVGRMKLGQMTYVCSVGVHNQVGPNNDRYICVARTLAQPCVRCQEADLVARDPDADEEIIKALRPARYPQCLYYVWDRNSENKGVQLFPVSYFYMEKDLQNRAKQPKQLGSGKIIYAHPGAGEQGGRHIKFTVEGQGRMKKYTAHEFYVRKQPIPESILRQAREYPPLDALLVWPDQDELLAATRLGMESAPAPYGVQQGQGQNIPGPQEKACPYGGQIGADFGKWEECRMACQERFYCEGLSGQGVIMEATPEQPPWQEPADIQPAAAPVQAPPRPMPTVAAPPPQQAPPRPAPTQAPRPAAPPPRPAGQATPRPMPTRGQKGGS